MTLRAAAAALGALSGFACVANSADITFGWDYPELAAYGYVLYCGDQSGIYSIRLDVGDARTATVSLPEGSVRFCAVRAYDSAGTESAFSNEVALSVAPGSDTATVYPTLHVVEPGGVELTPSGVRVSFNTPFDPKWFNLYASELGEEGPADVTLVGATTGPVRGSAVVSEDHRAITFIKTGGALLPDTYTLTIASRSNSLVDGVNRPLDGNGDGAPGDDYQLAFAILPEATPILSIGEIARGPGQQIHVPATEAGAGIPISILNGSLVRDVSFTLEYNPTLLNLIDVRLGDSISGQFTLKAIDPQTGTARIRIEKLSSLTNAGIPLLSLSAAVPAGAPYRSEQVLHLRDLQFNGGALKGRAVDGLHVVAKLGDTNADNGYAAVDALLIQRVIVRLDGGFSAFPTIDPLILGDVNVNGKLDAGDALLVQMKVVRLPVPQIPE